MSRTGAIAILVVLVVVAIFIFTRGSGPPPVVQREVSAQKVTMICGACGELTEWTFADLRQEKRNAEGKYECPECGEWELVKATRCPHCGTYQYVDPEEPGTVTCVECGKPVPK